MQFLRELTKDYKDEIQDILAEDRQLMAEIDFDLKRFEQQEKDGPLQTVSRIDRSIPPSDLVMVEENCSARTQTEDRRSRIQEQPMPPEVIEKSPQLENNGLFTSNIPTEVESQGEQQNAPTQSHVNAEKSVTRPTESQPQSVDGDGEDEREVEDNSLPLLEGEQSTGMKPPKRSLAKSRLPRSRIMSTPLRNVPNDDVSFQIHEADLSEIPHLDPEPKRRRL